jgi:hypothetical protein
MWSWLGQVASLIATASLIPIRARGTSPTRQKTPSRRYLEVRTLLDVWLGWRRFWIGSDVWSVRPRVTSSVITARSSADLKRPPLVVVLHSPFVAADYAEQISHGSSSSTSAWMALTLHGSGGPGLQVCWRALVAQRSGASPLPVPSPNRAYGWHRRPSYPTAQLPCGG